MARSFVSASSQYLEYAGAAVSAVPLTLACWYTLTALNSNRALLGVFNNSGTLEGIHLTSGSTNAILASTSSGGVSSNATSSTTVSNTAEWHHACAVIGATNSRIAYLDGGGKATNTATRTPAGVNVSTIGRRSQSTPGTYHNGLIAEAGIWSAALDDAEVAALARGACPLLVRPGALVAYWPLFGQVSPEPDQKGRFELTVTGATAASHVKVIRPGRRRRALFVPAALAGGVPRQAMHQARMRRQGVSR